MHEKFELSLKSLSSGKELVIRFQNNRKIYKDDTSLYTNDLFTEI